MNSDIFVASLIETLKSGALMQFVGRAKPPMDPWAVRILNRVLGNISPGQPEVPIMECTLTGPIIRARKPALIAIGAPEGALSLPLWEPIRLAAGEELDLRKLGGSGRIYFGLVRDVDSPGNPYRQFGKLLANSRLRSATPSPSELAYLADGPPQSLGSEMVNLCGQVFRLLPASDRRGLRYKAPREVKGGREIPPEPMTYGAIQLPPSGDPVIVGPDGPVTGGYARIGTVALASLRQLAWQLPGGVVTFTQITRAEALKQALDLEEALARDVVPC